MYRFTCISLLLACLFASSRLTGTPDPSSRLDLHQISADTNAQTIDSLALQVLPLWMRYLRETLSPQCLPRNEAHLSESTNGNFSSDYFVPTQLGFWILTAILSHEVREQDPDQTWGYEEQALLDTLSCMMSSLENILANYAYVDSLVTGKKALYQVHLLTGEAPLNTPFASTVSMLDNLYLITALRAASNWAEVRDTALANRMEAAIAEFDLSMWLYPNQQWRLGGPSNPRDGAFFDRLISESRLVLAAALAQDHQDTGEFLSSLNQVRAQSQSYTSSSGISMEYVPYFGTALEKWVASTFLSSEVNSRLGVRALLPMISIQGEVRCSLGLPADITTGIGDGFGGFLELTMDPSEILSTHHNLPILVPPAVMMQAGVMAKHHPVAACNFCYSMDLLADSSQLAHTWGPANYLDIGTGLVNRADSVYGTLEIEQGALSLLNMLLGGTYLEDLLRQDSSWHAATEQYIAALDHRLFSLEGETGVNGDGYFRNRSKACMSQTWYLPQLDDTACYSLSLDSTATYTIRIRYSNDDNSAVGDTLLVRLDGVTIGKIATANTRGPNTPPGGGWNEFTISEVLDIGELSAGQHSLCLVLDHTDGYGIEIDAMILEGDFEYQEQYVPTLVPCCATTSIERQEPAILELRIYPNPVYDRAIIAFDLAQTERLSLSLTDLSGKVLSRQQLQLPAGHHEIPWAASHLPAGLYFLLIRADGDMPIVRKIRVVR